MNIIIPLGGLGERFKNENFTKPKPLIPVLGKYMIEIVIDNLHLNKYDKLIIVYNNYLNNYNFDTIMKNKYDNIILIELIKQTEGAVETILYALNFLEQNYTSLLNNKCILVDGDTIYNKDIISIFRNQNNNAVFCFTDIEKNLCILI